MGQSNSTGYDECPKVTYESDLQKAIYYSQYGNNRDMCYYVEKARKNAKSCDTDIEDQIREIIDECNRNRIKNKG